MKILGYFLSIALFASSQALGDELFETQVRMLDDKARLCTTEINTEGRAQGFCEDFQRYQDFLFRGSARTFIEFNMANGNINAGNADRVMGALRNSLEATRRVLPAR